MDVAARPATTPDSLRVVFEDGFGSRLRTPADPAAEFLEIRPALADVPAFEFAVRERVARLGAFRHPFFARVRAVERTAGSNPRLTIVSEIGPGLRLSDLLAGGQARHTPIDISAALCLLRQLVPAIAMLHESARDVAHAAIAPERLVVTSQGRLLITEHVLGAALTRLGVTREQYWHDLRVALPAGVPPKIDQRADVLQLGIVALSLILGRPLRADEFPGRIADVVASTWAVSARGGFEPLPPGLRGWLARVLQIDDARSFRTAVEARLELDAILGDGELIASPASVEAFLARFQAAQPVAGDTVATFADPLTRATAAVVDSEQAGESTQGTATVPVREPAPATLDASRAQPESRRPASSNGASGGSRADGHGPDAAPTSAGASAAAQPATGAPLSVSSTGAAAGRAAAVDAALPAPIGGAQPMSIVPAPAAAPIIETPAVQTPIAREMPVWHEPAPISTNTSAGPTPVRPADGGRPTIGGDRPPRATPEQPSEEWSPLFDDEGGAPPLWRNWRVVGAAAAVITVLVAGWITARRPTADAATPPASGTLEITTNPEGIDAYIDGELRGATPLVLALDPGAHMVELRGAGEPKTIPISINPGMKVAQYVELSRGPAKGSTTAKVRPAPAAGPTPGLEPAAAAVASATGSVSITAPFEVQILEHGVLLGTSRQPVRLAAGHHELELVNSDLGVRSSSAVDVVEGGQQVAAVDVPTTTVSFNATPWAEVWLDGEKIGETPIGSASVRVGTHDVVFRHPDLGERHQVVTATAKGPTRVSADFGSGQ